MSGGSYNYLCYTDSSDISNKIDDLKEMAIRLRSLGFDDACEDTLRVVNLVKDYEDELQKQINKMYHVWRGVEWMDSGDLGMEELKQDIEDYRNKSNPK